jgi:ABC-2 type transport system permease protein
MLHQILQFELRYWLRRPMPWVFLFINALLVFFAVTSDNITIGQSYGSVHKNAPYVVLGMYANMSIIMLLMATAFVQGAALRDFNYQTDQIIFSTPLRKFGYLMGRYLGAVLIACLPLLGISLAILIGGLMPWLEAEQVGPIYWSAHLQGFLLFALPNTLLIGAIVFAIAALTRSTIASFVGAIGLLVAYAIAGNLTSDLDNERLAMLLDPFGLNTYELSTKYWTVADKNTQVLSFGGIMALNRLLWLGMAALIWAATYWSFSFSPRQRRRRRQAAAKEEILAAVPTVLPALPTAALSFSAATRWRQILNQARLDFWGMAKSIPFIIILFFGLLNMGTGLAYVKDAYGLTLYPVTYNVISTIQGSMYLFTVAILIFFSGALIWKERDARVDEIYDSLPYPTWVPVLAKLLAMLGLLFVIQLLAMLGGIVGQTLMGYTKYELGVYAMEMLVIDWLRFAFIAVLSMLFHTLINNKYLAYFAVVAFLIANLFIWVPLDVESLLLRYGSIPSFVYSDMNGFGPFVPGIVGFKAYWLLFAGILVALTAYYWLRGKDTAWGQRQYNARLRFSGKLMLGLGGAWALVAGFAFYNTQILNTYDTTKESRRLSADYEKKYKAYTAMPQPYLTDVRCEIDLYPEQRKLEVQAAWTLVNKDSIAIDSLFFNLPSYVKLELEVERGSLIWDDERLKCRLYALHPPLAPGDTLRLRYTGRFEARGFENELSFTEVVQNGSFFNNSNISPALGYSKERELSEKRYRKKHGLPEQELVPPLEHDCAANCRNHYISPYADWVTGETILSTSPDQIAVAPGSLLKEWEENGRRYFHYRLDHPSMNFYSFISARYEVAREDWNGLSLEVYYHRGHEYNVENMLRSMRQSLAYFSENFSPYRHRQARIIEFPRYGSFAQAFPGTMPYSEGIGFIAQIESEDDIDMVFYVVAHEMAHQWWAHQVIGANMQGATLLSETMAQYSALMVMEKEYGREQMQKFLKYEMDRYLRGRGQETEREKPLMEVYPNQGYIHYRKGSVAMYYLKEMIGEEQVNAALRSVIERFAYQEPPYPTAHHLVDAFRAHTPDSLQYLIADLFETITLFDNRMEEPVYRQLEDGRYEVSFEISAAKFRADTLGAETPIPINDWIDVGVYAKPENGKKRGKPLYWQRHLITAPRTPLRLIVDELPHEAGIDPNYYLIDRIPEDNVKRVKSS